MITLLALASILIPGDAGGAAPWTGDWTKPVEVRHDVSRCVSYRARLSGSYLVVEATLEPGWHTFAMDNDRRAAEKLAGKKSLGVERPTEITVTGGLETVGSWLQTPPKDASQPDLNWFTWIFEEKAVFATRVGRMPGAESRISVRGQVCTESSCVNVEVEVPLPLPDQDPGEEAPPFERDGLVPVKEKQ